MTEPDDRSLDPWLAAALAGDDVCPPLELLHAVATGDASADADRGVRLHATQCAACRVEMNLAATALAAAPTPQEEAAVDRIAARLESTSPVRARVVVGPWRRYRAPLLLAAAMLVLLVGVRLWREAQAPPLPPALSGTLRGGGPGLISPVGDVPAAPAFLEWRPLDGATSYRVFVERIDGTPVWSAESATARLALPEDVAGSLAPGVTYHWRAEALDADGSVLSVSPLESFRIDPGSIRELPRG